MPVLDPRGTIHHSYSAGDAGAGLSGGDIAAIIIGAMLLIFICAYYSQYSKAKKLQAKTGKPISHGSIFGYSLLYAVGVGFVLMLCSSCGGGGDGNDTGGGNDAVADTGVAPISAEPTPMDEAPQMNWDPINSAATDGVQ